VRHVNGDFNRLFLPSGSQIKSHPFEITRSFFHLLLLILHTHLPHQPILLHHRQRPQRQRPTAPQLVPVRPDRIPKSSGNHNADLILAFSQVLLDISNGVRGI